MTVALVTGAAGFFGQAIVSALAHLGCEVVATDRLERDAFSLRTGTPSALVSYVQRDLTEDGIDDIVAEVDGVVHAAALTLPDDPSGVSDTLLRANLGPLPALLSSIRTARNCGRLILISSAGVFDQVPERTLREADADGGRTLYGAAKLAGELIASRYCSVHGIEYAAVRPTSLFGPGEAVRPSRPLVSPLARIVEFGAAGVPVRVEHSTARCDWLSVDDAADAVAMLWSEAKLGGRAFNLSNGHARPFSDVVDVVTRVTGLHVDSNSTDVVDGGPDRAATVDSSALKQQVGWEPSRSLEDGIRDILADIRSETSPCLN